VCKIKKKNNLLVFFIFNFNRFLASRIVEVDSDSVKSELRDKFDENVAFQPVKTIPIFPVVERPATTVTQSDQIARLQLSHMDSSSKAGEPDATTNRISVGTNRNLLTPAITDGNEGFTNLLSVSSIVGEKRASKISVGTISEQGEPGIKEIIENLS